MVKFSSRSNLGGSEARLDSVKSRCSREGKEVTTESQRPRREVVPARERRERTLNGRIGGDIEASIKFCLRLNSTKSGKISKSDQLRLVNRLSERSRWVRGRKTSTPQVLRTSRLERLVEVMERWERLDSKLQGRLVGRAEWDTANL